MRLDRRVCVRMCCVRLRRGQRPGIRWDCVVCAVLVLALVLGCLGVWLLYISVCGCVSGLGLRRG